ncbi:methylated-DNA--[protein]-cysteine S-methyltransferase [Alishewanella sp. 16-MA]|uniref:Methylated-DNA--protein-cysteine methyltransferase n=1 Tax=Alishewanella maricola TaxID=2795740 RepID=A0ABS8C2G9_9ALTE|nr:methylated-DNA--[protein]-cysteine S-methyltransferase [Alishewanella maricola]MCB5226531.1 methylated-DNA--[protein]-cysteine S-methyltransferase [Alishewanella maricola]
MQGIDYLASPLGLVEIVANEAGVVAVTFCQRQQQPSTEPQWTREAKAQLAAYFAGELTVFQLPLAAEGTPFQQHVWQALLTVPYGQTASYGDIAKQIGNPKGMRAVGLANSKNPISIIVPCHRVIGANKTLTGYAGGVDKKAWLLAHEGVSGLKY